MPISGLFLPINGSTGNEIYRTPPTFFYLTIGDNGAFCFRTLGLVSNKFFYLTLLITAYAHISIAKRLWMGIEILRS